MNDDNDFDAQYRAKFGGDNTAEDTLRDTFLMELESQWEKRTMDGAEFVLGVPKVLPSMWGKDDEVIWVEGESLMIAGMPGLGKTTLAGLLLRAQIRGGGEVLGYPVAGRDHILYLASDRPAQARRAITRQFTEADGELLKQKVTFVLGPTPADVVREPRQLLWMAEYAGVNTVYIDSVKDIAMRLSDDEVGAAYNKARQHLVANDIQLCELHHTVKRNATGGIPSTIADVYGSTWITAGTGSVLLLIGDPGDPLVECKHIRQPMTEVGPWVLLHDEQTGEMSIHDSRDPLKLLEQAGPDGLTARQFAIQWLDSDSRAAVEKARRRLEKLEAADLAHSVPGTDAKKTAVWFTGPKPAVML